MQNIASQKRLVIALLAILTIGGLVVVQTGHHLSAPAILADGDGPKKNTGG